MSRFFFTGDIGDIQHLQARYVSMCKVPNEEGKKGLERVFKPLIGSKSKSKPSSPKQFVKFKCQIRFKITKKFANKCLGGSSLWHSRKNLHYITSCKWTTVLITLYLHRKQMLENTLPSQSLLVVYFASQLGKIKKKIF